jgi:hypothetical protein
MLRQQRHALGDELLEAHAGWQVPQIAPAPALPLAREVAALLEEAQQVREVEWIPLGVAVEVREQVATGWPSRLRPSASRRRA